MKAFLLLLFIALYFQPAAQDQTIKTLQTESGKTVKKDPDDTLTRAWKTGGLFSFTLGQATLDNWAAGGDIFSLTINTLINTHAFYQKDKHSWDNTFDINLGYIKTTSLGSRKNDDRFDLLSKYGYALGPKLNAALLFNLRSQFFKGFTYKDDTRTLSSAFMSPGYFLLSPGLDYKPATGLSIFASPITYRLITVIHDSLSARGLYGVDPGKKTANEFGAFATIGYLKDFSKSVSYKGRLDLFSNYRKKPKNVDLFMANVLSTKLGKVLAVNWNVDLIYDDDVRLFGPNKTSPALQLKSIVGVGLQLKF